MQTGKRAVRPDAKRNRPAGKPMKEAPKKKAGPQTAQQTLPYREIYKELSDKQKLTWTEEPFVLRR